MPRAAPASFSVLCASTSVENMVNDSIWPATIQQAEALGYFESRGHVTNSDISCADFSQALTDALSRVSMHLAQCVDVGLLRTMPSPFPPVMPIVQPEVLTIAFDEADVERCQACSARFIKAADLIPYLRPKQLSAFRKARTEELLQADIDVVFGRQQYALAAAQLAHAIAKVDSRAAAVVAAMAQKKTQPTTQVRDLPAAVLTCCGSLANACDKLSRYRDSVPPLPRIAPPESKIKPHLNRLFRTDCAVADDRGATALELLFEAFRVGGGSTFMREAAAVTRYWIREAGHSFIRCTEAWVVKGFSQCRAIQRVQETLAERDTDKTTCITPLEIFVAAFLWTPTRAYADMVLDTWMPCRPTVATIPVHGDEWTPAHFRQWATQQRETEFGDKDLEALTAPASGESGTAPLLASVAEDCVATMWRDYVAASGGSFARAAAVASNEDLAVLLATAENRSDLITHPTAHAEIEVLLIAALEKCQSAENHDRLSHAVQKTLSALDLVKRTTFRGC